MYSSSRYLYILDTSAIRGLSQQRLREIGKWIPLAVSPYTVLELLSHLTAGEFLRYKVEMSKLEDIDILMFPRTELPRPQASDSVLLNWTSLRNAMPSILLCVKKAESYSQFTYASVPFGNGLERLSLCDFGLRVKEDLTRLKKDYSDLIEEVIKDLSRYDNSSLNTPNEHRFVAHVKEAMRPSLETLRKVNPSIDEGTYYDRLYSHVSFLILRALRYVQKRRGAPNAKVDKNDYVDSNLCLHLDLRSPCILVTQDNALRKDLSWTLDAIKVAHEYTPECRVEDTSILVSSRTSA